MVVSWPPREQRIQRRPVRIAPLLLVALLTVSACSGDGDGALPATSTGEGPTTTASTLTNVTSTTSSTTSETTAPDDDPEAEVLDRYLAFWEARFAANTDPVDPEDPQLAEFATGAQLDNVREETRQRADAGVAFRRPGDSVTERRPRVVEISDDVARIQDCAINDSIVYRVTTGEVIDDSVVTRSVSATMRLVDGRWRLESAREIQKWEGVAGCAFSSDS